VANLLFSSDTVVWASWRYIDEENIPSLRHINEVKGAFVIGGARLHLYSYLDRLHEKSLYSDSVVFYVRGNAPVLIPCGDKLGDMLSELKPGEHVTEFVSAGANNYASKIANSATGETKTDCKVRGVTELKLQNPPQFRHNQKDYFGTENPSRHCHGSYVKEN
jgi:hypothetical protein